jgi:enoyl-CoA hydratase/carnithine racemase
MVETHADAETICSADPPMIANRNLSGPLTIEMLVPHVALVTISRPEARNAISAEVTERMSLALRETEASPTIWAVILTGTGTKAFCAGADLKEVSLGKINTLNTASGGFAAFVHAQRTKPWIAAVDGPAVAGGFEIALACDMIVASRDATFGLPEVRRGLLAAAGGVYRLVRMLPRQLALELIATGGTIDAERLATYGVVNRLSASGGAVNEALKLALSICENAPLAVRESLAIARRALDLSDADLAKLSLEAQGRLEMTEDFREGPMAFLEKRAPQWSGR